MHTFYKVLQKNTLRKKICVFLCALCTASLVVLSNANAAGYTCDSKTYVECNKDYYLSDCGEVGNFKTNGGDSDSCKSCPDNHSCDGGTKCPVRNMLSVSCNDGQYIKKGATTCSDCPAGYFCTGTTHKIDANGATSDTGATACAKGSYSTGGTSTCTACTGGQTTSGTGQTSCQDCSDKANVATWETTSWSNNTVSNLCKVKTCNAGSIKGDNKCTQCGEGTYSGGGTATSCTDCVAGTYQGAKGKSSCIDCTGRTKYSGAKATSCSDVTGGYYTTGCDNSGNKCTGQTQCTGATYCSGGVQYNCPSQTDGWTRNTGTGWTQVSECNQTKAATSISSYCSEGQLKQIGKSQDTWDTASASVAFKAAAGSYVSGTGASTTCKQCEKGYYSAGGKITSCTACGKGTYQDTKGQSSCKDCTAIENAEWSDANATGRTENDCPFTCTGNHTADTDNRQCKACDTAKPCPTGYGDSTYDTCKGETPEAKCKANCQPGTYVAAANAKCSDVPSTAKGYAEQHYVQYGGTSTLSPCPNGATGNNAKASLITHCYKDCPTTKNITNGTTKFASGHVYYSSQNTGYTNSQCYYTVDCDAKYGANSASATTSPNCTLCRKGYYSAGNEGEQCKQCTGMPTGGVAEYTTNATTPNGCLWHCNEGRYRYTTTVVASGGVGTKTTYSCNTCKTNTSIPVTSSWDPVDPNDLSKGYKNDKITGCFISSTTATNQPTVVTDSTGSFKYRILDNDGNFNPCYHK